MSQAERLNGTGFALAVHGGAGTIPRDETSLSRRASYHDGLRRALTAGREILAAGGSALDAVTEAVATLEDDPLFNAGRGSVFTRVRTQEMDACVMDGTERRAGAVAGVFGPRNPVRAARAVMERSRHVLLIGHSPFVARTASRSASPAISAAKLAGGNCRTRSNIWAERRRNTARWAPSPATAAGISPPPPRPAG
jgi:isoaspartyl peptidase/L-asparaginase-like protein (Ntn-hydrolase superfamily)